MEVTKTNSKIFIINNRSLFCNQNNYSNSLLSKITNKIENIKQTKKKINYKGLGYKVFKILNNKNTLVFKIGKSHLSYFKLNNQITNVVIKKNRIVLNSTNISELGNSIEKIYKLKPQNRYKLKGFYMKNKLKKIKEVKKK